MADSYRIAVNVEWTSKCNALCTMCPRDAIEHPQLMADRTWQQTLKRLSPQEVFRVVIAGYGEPTTHPQYFDFVEDARRHPVRFDMVSNGHLLDPEKLAHLDGAVGLLIVSFSSIDPDVYGRVHVNLDQRRVMENLKAAQQLLKRTTLGISLTPMPECLPSLPDTIAWLKAQGIHALTMSPTLYNRGGNLKEHALASERLRALIREHGLHSQELDFIPSGREIFRQWCSNRYKCVPRNVDLFIAASGDYLYCYNDVGHRHPIGNVADDPLRAVLRRREDMAAIPALCDDCNMRDRYGAGELLQTGISFVRQRLRQVA
ncbi:radical SAM protein [Azospira restricta]|uniref:Radical SAM protein n=1 Tax=Azospira restricta TaxID=404405 RepID=A0A974PYX5_9RHOO|nr:radical SAM protein [Azospira restricta]QRJ63515.1 radical SAM protein [Azospira restricta]